MEAQLDQPQNDLEQPESNPAEFDHETVGHGVLRKKDLRMMGLLRIGHEGVMMDKINRQNRIVEDSVKGLQKEAGYETSQDPSNEDGEEDMGVSIGNETRTEHHYHYEQPKTEEKPVAEENKTSKWLMPAAILGAGALTGAGIYASKEPSNPPAVVVPDDKDTMIDTDIAVGFGKPQKIESLDLVPLDEIESPEGGE